MSVYIAGYCSVPGCALEPPKDENPFCQSHYARLPGRIRRRLGNIWKSRTKGHHGKVVKGHDWQKAIKAGVRYFGALPRDEMPREEREAAEIDQHIADQTRKLLEQAAMPDSGIDPVAARAIHELATQAIQEGRKQPMAVTTTAPKVEKDGLIHVGGRRYTPEGYEKWREGLRKAIANRKANAADRRNGKTASNGDTPHDLAPRNHRPRVKLIHNGQPNRVALEAFKDWMLERYQQGLAYPSQPEEIFTAGMAAGAARR